MQEAAPSNGDDSAISFGCLVFLGLIAGPGGEGRKIALYELSAGGSVTAAL